MLDTDGHLEKWKDYPLPDCLIWVFDSSEWEQRQTVYTTIQKLFTEEVLTNMPILILLNKSDLHDIVSTPEVAQVLKFQQQTRLLAINPCVATTGSPPTLVPSF